MSLLHSTINGFQFIHLDMKKKSACYEWIDSFVMNDLILLLQKEGSVYMGCGCYARLAPLNDTDIQYWYKFWIFALAMNSYNLSFFLFHAGNTTCLSRIFCLRTTPQVSYLAPWLQSKKMINWSDSCMLRSSMSLFRQGFWIGDMFSI